MIRVVIQRTTVTCLPSEIAPRDSFINVLGLSGDVVAILFFTTSHCLSFLMTYKFVFKALRSPPSNFHPPDDRTLRPSGQDKRASGKSVRIHVPGGTAKLYRCGAVHRFGLMQIPNGP